MRMAGRAGRRRGRQERGSAVLPRRAPTRRLRPRSNGKTIAALTGERAPDIWAFFDAFSWQARAWAPAPRWRCHGVAPTPASPGPGPTGVGGHAGHRLCCGCHHLGARCVVLGGRGARASGPRACGGGWRGATAGGWAAAAGCLAGVNARAPPRRARRLEPADPSLQWSRLRDLVYLTVGQPMQVRVHVPPRCMSGCTAGHSATVPPSRARRGPPAGAQRCESGQHGG